jgi:TPR repeat protein
MRRLLPAAAAALLSISTPAFADTLDDAFAAYNKHDYETAVRLGRTLAERGNSRGRYFLGFLYALGDGVPQNFVLAYMWFSLAAAQGEAEADKFRDRAATSLTPEQLAEAQRLAREWVPQKYK